MYLEFFGFERLPFRITPDTRSFYTGGDRGIILRALVYAIASGEAIVKLVGEVGSGKTMLCRMLVTKLPGHIDIVYLANPRLTPDNILQAIAFELGMAIDQHQASSRVLMLRAVQDYLLEKHFQRRQVVVVVEEAQSMPLETLEEIRLLSNLETERAKLLQIVLIGQPELNDNLNQQHVRQIKDRITQNITLPPLKAQDIQDYLIFRLHAAGYHGENLFTRAAQKLIARAAGGLMRRINILADKSLLSAFANNARKVKRSHVAQALGECEFIKPVLAPRPALMFSLIAATAVGISGLLGMEWQHAKQAQRVDVNLLPSPSAGVVAAQMPKPSPPPLRTEPVKSSEQSVPANTNPASVVDTVLPVPPSKILIARSEISAKWLSKINPNHYSIQVLLNRADSIRELERFLEQEGIGEALDKLYLVKTQIRKTPMIGVLYGEFASYAEAQQALLALPAPLRRYQPYVRSLRQLLKDRLSY